jgi:hypothetical protein
MKSLSALVEDMVTSNSQCNIISASTIKCSTSTSPPTDTNSSSTPIIVLPIPTPAPVTTTQPQIDLSIDIDEGFCDGPEGPNEEDIIAEARLMASLRRTSSPAGIRKYSSGVGLALPGTMRWRTSSDHNAGPGTVFCPPRMRKRIARRKRSADAETA